jgi:hypothetical protein
MKNDTETQFFINRMRNIRGKYVNGVFGFFLFIAMLLHGSVSHAAYVYTTNYVVFYVEGDCGAEDCISVVYSALSSIPGIVKIDAAPLASHQTASYKTVTVSFANLKDAPFELVMKAIAKQGYQVVSYVIHDTHTPHKDVIIPH